MTCGKCGGSGHNSRSCAPATSVAPVKAEVVKGQIDKVETVIPDPPVGRKTKIDMRDENPRPRRPAPTADTGTAATASPFRCTKCNSVAILVIVRVKDHHETFRQKRDVFKGDQRCEHCLNKPDPAELILKWGALPDEKLSPAEANAI